MKATIRAATDTGRVRSHNEDYHATVTEEESPEGVDALLVVADGMGGHAAGEVASRITVEGIIRSLDKLSVGSLGLDEHAFEVLLGRVLQEVNQDVWQAAQEPNKRGMGTTCTLVVIRNDRLFLAHIGDSRAYLLRHGALCQFSKDHSWVEDAIDQGIITREQARTHPNRNVITRAIGLDRQAEIDTSSMTLAEGDLLLLCSDGLNAMIPDDEIRKLLAEHKLNEVCQVLVNAANDQGGHDNITVLVARLGSLPEIVEMTQPTALNRETHGLSIGMSRLKSLLRTILRKR